MHPTSVCPFSHTVKSRQQAATIDVCRPFVAEIVRKRVTDPARWEEANQVALLGVLVALEKGGSALRHIENELHRWEAQTRP